MSDDVQPLITGEPMPLDELLGFADLTEAGVDSAIDWWDENASDLFIGVLEQ